MHIKSWYTFSKMLKCSLRLINSHFLRGLLRQSNCWWKFVAYFWAQQLNSHIHIHMHMKSTAKAVKMAKQKYMNSIFVSVNTYIHTHTCMYWVEKTKNKNTVTKIQTHTYKNSHATWQEVSGKRTQGEHSKERKEEEEWREGRGLWTFENIAGDRSCFPVANIVFVAFTFSAACLHFKSVCVCCCVVYCVWKLTQWHKKIHVHSYMQTHTHTHNTFQKQPQAK